MTTRALAVHAAADSAIVAIGARLLQAMEAPACIQSLDEPTMLAILARVPRYWHPVLHSVCKVWRVLVRNEGYVEARRACPLTGRPLLEPFVLTVGGSYDTNCRHWDKNHGRASMLVDDGLGRKKWVLVKPLPQVATTSSLVGLNSEFYCLGSKHDYGTDVLSGMFGMGSKACACCMIFSPRTNCWRAAPPMNEARYSTAACACDGKLYVFGGLKLYEEEVPLRALSPKILSTTTLPFPRRPRSSAASASTPRPTAGRRCRRSRSRRTAQARSPSASPSTSSAER